MLVEGVRFGHLAGVGKERPTPRFYCASASFLSIARIKSLLLVKKFLSKSIKLSPSKKEADFIYELNDHGCTYQ